METQLLDFTHPLHSWNVAIDEAIINHRNEVGGAALLRLWEPGSPLVVLGRSSRVAQEVNLDACTRDEVAVIRRCSGGATIVTSTGCLMYAIVLPYELFPELRKLDEAHRFVMGKIQNAIRKLGVETEFQGTCDLTLENRKVSGNAVRVTKDWLLYHGTLICTMDTHLIAKYLGTPERQPDYRQNRGHLDFVTQLPLAIEDLKAELVREWNAKTVTSDWPESSTRELVEQKYSRKDWNHKR